MFTSWTGLRLLSKLPSNVVPLHQRITVNMASTRRWFRSASFLEMPADWYDFKAICSSDYAIMVTNKDIKETHRPGSTKEDLMVETNSSIEEDAEEEDLLDAPLDKEDVDWLLDRAPEFKAYQIGESFVLFTKGHNDLREAPSLHVPGPYSIEDEYNVVRFHIEEAPKGELYMELFELAGKFTPPGSKLSFPPGKYSFATTDIGMMAVKLLKRCSDSSSSSSSSASDDTSKEINSAGDDIDAPVRVPFDFDLIVGNEDKMKTIGVYKAVFLCCFPNIETRLGVALTDTKLALPELDPWAAQLVLDAFSSRSKVERHGWHPDVQNVQSVFGKSMVEMASEKTPNESSRLEHPAIADPRWLDTSFLCGPQREEIKVNRSVLASMNPVLHRVLFGTDLNPVDPSKPIEWPDFDARAVRQVFLALLHCGKKEFVVPMESVDSVKMLVDYLGETREALMLYYDTPFKKEYHGRDVLRRGRDWNGLQFSYD